MRSSKGLSKLSSGRSRRPPSPAYRSYDQLRSAADEFLKRYWPTGNVPVDVEHIVDVELRLDVVPVPYLLDDSEIDGLLSADRSTIWVDEAAFSNPRLLYRYRFTLAHELGHWYLHRDLFEATDFKSVEEWKEFISQISEEDRSWYEWLAYAFGGLILVQEEPLGERIETARKRAAEGGFDLDLDIEAHCEYLAEHVGRRFDVSGRVILKRGYYDGYWTFR